MSIYGEFELCTGEHQNIEKKQIKAICKLEYDEEFKILNLPNYKNYYKISNYGKVFSLKNNIYKRIYAN